MSEVVVDTNVLLNLATPVVDGRSQAPSGEDPLKTVLGRYDVHVPESVLAELQETRGDGDLLSAAADLVFAASRHLTTHDVEADVDDPLEFGLDRSEAHGIWLANERETATFVTDEFSSTNYLVVSLALDDRDTLYTTPHLLCTLADRGVLDANYVDAASTYYVETKGWDPVYVNQLRRTYLGE